MGPINNQGFAASVIIVNHDQPWSLLLSLKVLAEEGSSVPFEIIISDDGSKKNLLAFVKKFFESSSVPIRYVWQPFQQPRPGMARNNAVRMAKGDVLIFLDGDIVPGDKLVQQHVAYHTQPRLLVAGDRYWRGFISRNSYRLLSGLSPTMTVKTLLDNWPVGPRIRKIQELEQRRRTEWLNSHYPWKACFGANFSVRRSPEVLYREGFVGWSNDDWELTYRLYSQSGYQVVYDPMIISIHLESRQTITNPFRNGESGQMIQYIRNIFYFHVNHPDLPVEELFFAFHRLHLDTDSDTWKVLPRSKYLESGLNEKIALAGKWLKDHNLFPLPDTVR